MDQSMVFKLCLPYLSNGTAYLKIYLCYVAFRNELEISKVISRKNFLRLFFLTGNFFCQKSSFFVKSFKMAITLDFLNIFHQNHLICILERPGLNTDDQVSNKGVQRNLYFSSASGLFHSFMLFQQKSHFLIGWQQQGHQEVHISDKLYR